MCWLVGLLCDCLFSYVVDGLIASLLFGLIG